MIFLKWLLPPRIKVFEALGCIADERVEFLPQKEVSSKINASANFASPDSPDTIIPISSSSSENSGIARVYSSSRGKFYTVTWEISKNSVMSNDNGSYWKGYLGYPSIAVLMLKMVLTLDMRLAEALKGISWKDINQKHKNDFSKTELEVFKGVASKGVEEEELIKEAEKVLAEIKKQGFELLGKKTKPPRWY